MGLPRATALALSPQDVSQPWTQVGGRGPRPRAPPGADSSLVVSLKGSWGFTPASDLPAVTGIQRLLLPYSVTSIFSLHSKGTTALSGVGCP